MCGTLKFENRAHTLGNIIPVINPATGKEGHARWAGFAQEERQEFWRTAGKAVDVLVPADHIIEQRIELQLRGVIAALGLKNNVNVHGRMVGHIGEVKILTRKPLSDFELSIHHRWPIVKTNDGGIQVFLRSDVRSNQLQLI